jgi:esterase/lipase superfamily enzyme
MKGLRRLAPNRALGSSLLLCGALLGCSAGEVVVSDTTTNPAINTPINSDTNAAISSEADPTTYHAMASLEGLEALVPIFYVTNRQLEPVSSGLEGFGSDPGVVSSGAAKVSLPALPGRDVTQWPTSSAQQGEPAVAFKTWSPSNEIDLAAAITQHASLDQSDTALVYIPGFMKRFDQAAEDLAEIVYGANFTGLPILFSWPAGENPVGYGRDTEVLADSIPALMSLFQALLKVEQIKTLHLIAHSMGSQAMLAAILNHPAPGLTPLEPAFGELILYAPDVDREAFLLDVLPRLSARVTRTTLYTAARDIPLLTSWVYNQSPRLGAANADVFIAGIETIDATTVAHWYDKHNYHLTRRALQDLGLLLNERMGAHERPTVKMSTTDTGVYWRLLPAQDPF